MSLVMSGAQWSGEDFGLLQFDLAVVRGGDLELPIFRAAEAAKGDDHCAVSALAEPASDPPAETSIVPIGAHPDLRLRVVRPDAALDDQLKVVDHDGAEGSDVPRAH